MSLVFIRRADTTPGSLTRFLDETGFDSCFLAGQTVIVKPNFVAPRESSTGATTHLELVEACVRRLQALGAVPMLLEMPGMEFDQLEVFDFLGVFDLCAALDIPVVMPRPKDFVRVGIPGGRALRSVRIPYCLQNAAILNLPVMKTHVITTVTLGAKNLMGLLHESTRRRMHVAGLDRAIRDLNMLLRPTLTIVDGLVGQEGDGAVYGNPVHPGLLLAGTDVAAVDRAACAVMGINPECIGHLPPLTEPFEVDDTSSRDTGPFLPPSPGRLYRRIYNAMYAVDYLWEPLFFRHFNETLYKSGRFGTRPRIRAVNSCLTCQKCRLACKNGLIDMEFRVDRTRCLRCLRCFETCPEGRIHVSGFSSPEHK